MAVVLEAMPFGAARRKWQNLTLCGTLMAGTIILRTIGVLACRRFCCRKENAPKPEDWGIIHEL